MRWTEITEEPHQRRTAPQKVTAEELQEKCPIAWDNYEQGYTMFRGLGSPSPTMAFGDSTTQERKSKNTGNHYTLFLQTMPAWKPYPNRARSFICSTNIKTARAYGGWSSTAHVVFPVGDPIVGICPRGDFWECFPKMEKDFGFDGVQSLNSVLDSIFGAAGIQTPRSPQELLMSLEEAYKWLIQNPGMIRGAYGHTEKFLKRFSSFKGTLAEYIAGYLDPKKNGFRYCHLSEFAAPPNSEVWFAGPAYFVDEEVAKLTMRPRGR